MIRVVVSVAAGLAVLFSSGLALAQDDARAAGDTSRQSLAPGDIPADGSPASQPGAVCPPDHPVRDYPRAAHPGQCFARVRVPPAYESSSEQVLVAPARTERRMVPAVYDWAERQVLVEPARVERHVIPATWRSVTETEVVTPATTQVQRIDAVYDTVAEQVVVRPAHTEWRRTFVGPDGLLPEGAQVEATGEVVCLIEVPAEYATVQRRVLREPARTIETPIPAVTRTVTRQVIDQPEQVTETPVPAVYRTERYQRLVTPAHYESTVIPARYETRVRQRMVSPGRLEWRHAACDPAKLQGERG